MSKLLQKHIDELEAEEQELLEYQKDVESTKAEIAGSKAEVSLAAVGKLLRTVKESFDDFIECQSSTEHFDKNLGEMLSKAIKEIANIQARIEFKPTINVDIQPVATEIRNQNAIIVNLLEKLTEKNAEINDPLYQIIRAMVERNNAFIEKGIKQVDYSEPILKIAGSIPKRITKWEIVGSREANGQIHITATAKE